MTEAPQDATQTTPRLAVVTGGSRGIGKAISLELAREGYDIAVVYAGNADAAAQTVSEILSCGTRAQAWQCDVSDTAAAAAVCKDIIDTFGSVNVLVNNAGITRDNLVARISEADFDAVIDTNLKGTFNMIKALYRNFLRSRDGRIINISSVVGLQGNAGQANYAASKAGVIGLTKSLARELASRGVTVNAVAPGFIETDMTQKLQESVRASYESSIPLARLGSAQDVANCVAFLASPRASYITGEVIRVDGGLCM